MRSTLLARAAKVRNRDNESPARVARGRQAQRELRTPMPELLGLVRTALHAGATVVFGPEGMGVATESGGSPRAVSAGYFPANTAKASLQTGAVTNAVVRWRRLGSRKESRCSVLPARHTDARRG